MSLASQHVRRNRERKRAQEDVRKARDELEAHVEERTGELSAVNAQLLEEITERKRADGAMRRNEARYRTLFKSAPIAIREEDFSKVKAHIDALNIKKSKDFVAYIDRHPEFVAECAERIVEVDANEESLKLHNIGDKTKFLATFTSNFSDQALRTLKNVLVAVHNGETNLEFETFVVRADGSRRDVAARWSVAPGHEDTYSQILFTSVDVTERKRAEEVLRNARDELELRVKERTRELRTVNAQLRREITERKQTGEALRESEASLANAQRIAEIGSWEWNFETDEVHRSAEMCRLLGMTPKDLDTSHEAFLKRVHPDDRAAVDSTIDAMLNKREPFSLQFRIVLPDGSVRNVHEQGEVTLDDAGKPVLVAGTTQDITDRMRTQAQLIQASKLATLGEMTTSLAHELNQPLSVIRLAADNVIKRITDGKLDAQYILGKFERISAQTGRAADIIDHMQIFGRKVDGKPMYVDPREAIKQALGLVIEQFRLQGIEVETDFPDHCRKVLGHSVQLEQVLVDIMSNARDAIELNRGSPGDARKISLIVEDTGPHDTIRLVVKDTGGGIPENLISRIYEPFFTTKEVGKGTGLGLSIGYGIVNDMGGTIEAANADHGAVITITLPATDERSGAV